MAAAAGRSERRANPYRAPRRTVRSRIKRFYCALGSVYEIAVRCLARTLLFIFAAS